MNDTATPELYQKNAFRLTGLSIEAGARDLVRYGERMEMLHRLNGGIEPVSPAFPILPPPSLEDIRDALQRVRDPQLRLLDEFFWFWPVAWGEIGSDPALTALAHGQPDAAIAYWQGLLSSSALRGAALHNLAIADHLGAVESATRNATSDLETLKRDWRRVYQSWTEVLREDSAWNYMEFRIRRLDDPRLTSLFAREFRTALPGFLLALNVSLARRAAERGEGKLAALHADIIRASNLTQPMIAASIKQITEPHAVRISSLNEAAVSAAKASAGAGASAAERLFEQTKPILELVDLLCTGPDAKRQALHDEVATTGLSCLVIYGNSSEDWQTVLPLTEKAEKVAASDLVRARIVENLETVRRNVLYGTCWFCKKNPPDALAVHKIPMHGDVERETRFLQGTQVRWRKNIIDVPRCSKCAAAHGQARKHRNVGWALGLLVGWGSCVSIQDENGLLAIILFATFTGIGVILGKRAVQVQAASGTAPEASGRRFPSVLDLGRLGWEFGDKPNT